MCGASSNPSDQSKIKQPKERALDRLLSTSSNENLRAFLQPLSVPVNHQSVKLFWSELGIIIPALIDFHALQKEAELL